MELLFAPVRRIAGEIAVPGDKSLTHRAYLLAAVAQGTTIVAGSNPGADCRATLAALRALGVRITATGADALAIEGRPDGFDPPPVPLDLGNSGTGMRLLAGLLAGRNVDATLVGDASLSRRPMTRVTAPLAALGAEVTARGPGGTPPLEVRGARAHGHVLHGATVPTGVASAQVKSALLLAALVAEGRTTVIEPQPTRDHTERLLPAFGVACWRGQGGEIRIEGPVVPRATALHIPGDASAAAFWAVAASIAGAGEVRLPGVGVNPTRRGAFDVLRRMGAEIEVMARPPMGEEPVADLVIRPAALHGCDIAAEEVSGLIDELPALAAAQACATGVSTVRGAGELRVKETDRIAGVVAGLRALGIAAEEAPDGWSIPGGAVRGGEVDSGGDHRLAMAFGVLSLAAAGPICVRQAEMIDTSDPGFYHTFRDRVSAR